MDDIQKLIEKYKRELMEYSRAAPAQPPSEPLRFPEMTEETEQPSSVSAPEYEPPVSNEPPVPDEQEAVSPLADMGDMAEEPTRAELSDSDDSEDGMPISPETEEQPDEIEPPIVAAEPKEERRPQVIGYADSDSEDIFSAYSDIFNKMFPEEAEPNEEQNFTNVASIREVQEQTTENTEPGDNTEPAEEPSGVADNSTTEPYPNVPQTNTTSPEAAERLTEQPVSGTNPDEQLTGRNFENTASPQNNPQDIRPLDNVGTPSVGYKEKEYTDYEEFLLDNQKRGTMRFLIYTARGALPVENAICTISKTFGGEQHTIITLKSDNSGQTEVVSLPAPDRRLSQVPDSTIQPYALYDAQVRASGFSDVDLKNIPVFEGILSIQRVAMIPEGGGTETINEQSETNGGV